MPFNRIFRGKQYLIWTLGLSIPGKRRSWWRIFFFPVIFVLRTLASGFIVYSNWAKLHVEQKFNAPVYVAPNSTVGRGDILKDASDRIDRLLTNRPLQLLFIGRLTAQKKIDVLLRALSMVQTDMTLHIVGDGDAREELRLLATDIGLIDRIVFHGDIRNAAKKNSLIDASDLGIMPGLGGLFIQELHCRGCPVLAGIADGTEQDLVRKVTPDLYLETGTAEEIAAKLNHLSSNREGLATHVAAVLDFAREFYNVDVMAENWAAAVVKHLPK